MLKNSNWKNKVKPNLSQGEKNIRSFVKVFALMVFFFLLAVLIASIYNKQPPLTILCIVCLIMIFFSWLKLSPGLYNRIHRRKKLVPLGEKTDRKKILEDIYLSQTPYGLPFNFQVGNVIFPTPIYIMRDIGWIVYFCIQNQDIVIRARTIHGMSLYARRVKNRKILG